MPTVVSSIDIATSPDTVWALECDPHRFPEFADPTERMTDVPDTEFGVGYTYSEYGGIKPFLSESEWTVTAFEPKTRMIHEGDDGTMRFHLTIDITPVDGGTHLVKTLVMKPRWYMAPISALLWPVMMRKRAQETLDKTVANVKRITES